MGNWFVVSYMTKKLSLNDLRQMNMTQIMLGSKVVEDKFVSKEKVEAALTDGKKVLDSYDSDSGSLDNYGTVNDFDRHSCIEVYRIEKHRTEKLFQLELEDARVDGESYRVARIDFIANGDVVKRLFVR
jgi:hypothetical protein